MTQLLSQGGTHGRRNPPGEPRLIIPAFESFYALARDLSYLVIRLTVGGMLLVHGITKLTSTTVAAFAAGSLARRGLEPSFHSPMWCSS